MIFFKNLYKNFRNTEKKRNKEKFDLRMGKSLFFLALCVVSTYILMIFANEVFNLFGL
ncbi:MAG: hypothetical protein BAJALOKI2v1_630018 [Promethearchaeota archaeon]|nr:MAG: hypothetical protein BAJALOKI2v1_630018 [Candidatus Lokiarchaeota archaeon]